MKISMIAAMAKNRVIGKDNGMPWNLPDDLKRFRELTAGHPVILGRKTFESILAILGKPLPKRTSIVISRSRAPESLAQWGESVRWAQSLEAAIEQARLLVPPGGTEVFILGGAEIYRLALPQANRIYLTEIEAEIEGDATFPEFETGIGFRLRESLPHPADERHAVAFRFNTYER